MEGLQGLSIVLGSSLTSGINMYLTMAGIGIASRMGWLHVPGEMSVLAHPLVIGAAVVMYAIEFVADKIPVVDSAWDVVHTFIRPLGGAAIGYFAAAGAGPALQAAAGILTGSVALNSHLTKATSRVAINSAPTGIGNSIASVAEDSFVLAMLWFVIRHPIWAMVIAVVFIACSVWFLCMMFKFLKAFVRKLRGADEPASRPPAAAA